jgi:hypothetical protein
MRDIGYSFETALADIADNSITAKCASIEILCDADARPPVIAILDDGTGMSEAELIDAMRPGSKNPLDNRHEGDLGRFGLGLKTASFSQCRKLTVVTRKGSATSAAQWDLDYVSKKDDWLLQIPEHDEITKLPFADRLGKKGTLVIWQHLDRLADETQKTSLKDHIYEQLDSARKHLALIFHRFIAGERGLPKISILINGRPIEAYDPFHSGHPATQRQPEEKIRVAGAIVRIQPFVLPHHKKASRADWERYSGDGGYLQNQGFYVYRSGRLIIHGTWFRLVKKSELTKLARVRVDMPNELDDLWKIDVKKASASPPLVVRQRLRSVIDKIAGASNRVYTERGRRITGANATPFWARRVDKNQISYELNRQNPTIAGFFESLEEKQAKDFESLLRLVERSFPTDALFSDLASKPENLDVPQIDTELLKEMLALTIGYLKESGLSNKQIATQIRRSDPYRLHWSEAQPIVEKTLGGTADVG